MVTDPFRAASASRYNAFFMSFEARFRVRYAETDQMGVVYYANYLIWMELGRVELCRGIGVRYKDMEAEDGVLLAVVEANCRYLGPARYDEEIVVRTTIGAASPRGVRFEYEISSEESGRILAKGHTKHIFCGRDMKPARLPPKYYPVFGIRREVS
jgi:acyl-CoA thioester hydrolase